MTTPELVITPDLVNVAGAVSYWRLSGATDLGDLLTAWHTAGLDPKLLPKPVSSQVAFSRAVRDQATSRNTSGVRRFVTAVNRETYAVVEERVVKSITDSPSSDFLTYRTLVHVTDTNHDDVQGHGLAKDIVDEIRLAQYRHQSALDANDISAWLIRLAAVSSAVSLRNSGGVYFLPQPSLALWTAATRVLESVSSHKVFRIPAMKNDEAVRAVIDAVSLEAEQLVETFAAELGDLGDRAIETRKAQLGEMLKKVGMYERLLDQKMTDVRERIGALNAMATAGALVTGAGEGATP